MQCTDCKGTGKYTGLLVVEVCATCGGRGRLPQWLEHPDRSAEAMVAVDHRGVRHIVDAIYVPNVLGAIMGKSSPKP